MGASRCPGRRCPKGSPEIPREKAETVTFCKLFICLKSSDTTFFEMISILENNSSFQRILWKRS
jgi:hypothetical protein